jgi:NAD(P)H-hydrate epimerase
MEKYIPGENTVVMSRDEVRSFDVRAIDQLGIPGVVLMENAGRSCAELIKQILSNKSNPKVCIFCGTGNNGGDGFVIARCLFNGNFKVIVAICGERSRIKGDAKINLDILEHLGLPIEQVDLDNPDITSRLKPWAADADMIVDGLFGTGLTGQLDERYQLLINAINSLSVPILSIDIPSGLDCDTGESLGAVIKAAYTVTFVALKKGFTCEKALVHTGQIYIASIGVEPTGLLQK